MGDVDGEGEGSGSGARERVSVRCSVSMICLNEKIKNSNPRAGKMAPPGGTHDSEGKRGNCISNHQVK